MGEPAGRTHDVFVSYSSHDKPWADAACAVLERHRVRCWIAPRDITPGDEWGDAIIQGLNGSRLLVLIFSANANASGQVRREVERAISRGMSIVPVRIEDVRPEGAMEYALGNRHWLDAFTPPVERQLDRLARSVMTLLSQDPAPGEPPDEAGPRRPGAALWIAIAASLLALAALGAVLVMMKSGGGPKANVAARSTEQGEPIGDLATRGFAPSPPPRVVNRPVRRPIARPTTLPPRPDRVPPSGPARCASVVMGDWHVEGDQLVKNDLREGWVTFGDKDWTDYDLTFDADWIAGTKGAFGGGFRGSDTEWVYLFGMGGSVQKANLSRWSSKTRGGPFLQSVPCAIRRSEWYKVKVSLRGPRIRIELDGHTILSFTDGSSRRGPVGVRFYEGGGRFRNIRVTAPDGAVLWEGPPDLTRP